MPTDHAMTMPPATEDESDLPLSAEQCHAARLARDARFDSRFFTGVLSTGIYCRPVCPARRTSTTCATSKAPPQPSSTACALPALPA